MQSEIQFPKEEVSDLIIENQPDFKAALKLCFMTSGLSGVVVAKKLGTKESQLSGIWTNGRNLGDNKLILYMEICGNTIPLRWLAMKCGYGLHRLKSVVEMENEKLRLATAEKDIRHKIEIDVYKKIVAERK